MCSHSFVFFCCSSVLAIVSFPSFSLGLVGSSEDAGDPSSLEDAGDASSLEDAGDPSSSEDDEPDDDDGASPLFLMPIFSLT